MLEIPIRENGEVRWVEVDPRLLKNILTIKSKTSPTQQRFIEWWNLYDKKTTKKESIAYFKKHITDDLFKKIIEHTKEYVKSKREPAFTRFNVFLRDNFTCQYCGNKQRTKDLTFDHVVPRSNGGKTNWGNVVSACSPCNFKKGNKLSNIIGMFPLIKPSVPSQSLLRNNGKEFPPNFLHKSWQDFLYWDTELEN